MHSVTILFCGVFVSCVPLQLLFTGSAVSNKAPDYKELNIDYLLAFEKRMYTDYEELEQLVERTQLTLDQGKLTAAQQEKVRRWQHKLRSLLSFAQLARAKDPVDEANADTAGEPAEADSPPSAEERERAQALNKCLITSTCSAEERKKAQGLSSLILNRLRTIDATHIDPEQSNREFYQQLKANGHDNETVSQQAKDNFSRALIDKSLELTEKSVRKYYRLFPFAQHSYATVCKEVAAADCQHLQMQNNSDNFEEQLFTRVEQVTAEVNKAIADLNTIITMLARLKATKDVFFIFKETDFDNVAVMRLYHAYELILFNASRRGIFPVLLAPTFRARAGNIYLQHKGGLDFWQRLGLKKDVAHAPGEIKNPLLTEVSHAVVERSIAEIQRTTITRWVKWRKLKSGNKTFSDKKLYQQSIINEVATAQVVVQEPVHSVVVTHLLNRFQHKHRDPRALLIIRRITETIEFSMFPLMLGGATFLSWIFPPLAGIGLMGKAIVAATAANFVWVGVAGANTAIAHQRWVQLEQALLTGSSERYEDGLKLLREFNRTRRNAILAGSIGLPLSVPSIRYALNHMYDGKKTFFVDAMAGVFASRDEFGREDKTDSDLHHDR